MGKCIGCKCCVVACNEQNGNPAAINWRRVGEIEGGLFPNATRSYLSMGCNHCLEPTCLSGCPVDAYTKDPVTGIVRHSADACIGCQYCTWNCSYGVPQYNPERGVVGKCDMCHGRLRAGAGAGVRERLSGGRDRDRDRQRRRVARAPSTAPRRRPGLPADDSSLSTTRVTLPDALPPNAQPARHHARHARAPALVAGRHDRADAAVGRRLRDDLAAAAARRVRAPRASPRSRRSLVGGLALGAVDAAPGAAGARLSRAADVAALVAEPRGAAVRRLLRASPALYAGAAVVRRCAGRRAMRSAR